MYLLNAGTRVTCRVGPKERSRLLPPPAASSRRRKDTECCRLVGQTFDRPGAIWRVSLANRALEGRSSFRRGRSAAILTENALRVHSLPQ
jgi:hypothetical protein